MNIDNSIKNLKSGVVLGLPKRKSNQVSMQAANFQRSGIGGRTNILPCQKVTKKAIIVQLLDTILIDHKHALTSHPHVWISFRNHLGVSLLELLLGRQSNVYCNRPEKFHAQWAKDICLYWRIIFGEECPPDASLDRQLNTLFGALSGFFGLQGVSYHIKNSCAHLPVPVLTLRIIIAICSDLMLNALCFRYREQAYGTLSVSFKMRERCELTVEVFHNDRISVVGKAENTSDLATVLVGLVNGELIRRRLRAGLSLTKLIIPIDSSHQIAFQPISIDTAITNL